MVLLAVNFDNLHQILQNLYVDMMPCCYPKFGIIAFIPTSLLSQPKKHIFCKTDYYTLLGLG